MVSGAATWMEGSQKLQESMGVTKTARKWIEHQRRVKTTGEVGGAMEWIGPRHNRFMINWQRHWHEAYPACGHGTMQWHKAYVTHDQMVENLAEISDLYCMLQAHRPRRTQYMNKWEAPIGGVLEIQLNDRGIGLIHTAF